MRLSRLGIWRQYPDRTRHVVPGTIAAMKNACAILQTSLQTVFDHSLGYLERLEEKPAAATVNAHTLRPRIDREVLGSIHTSPYPLVLHVCRRFFRQPEDAEDAAAEVFLKLHLVLEKKNEEDPFRPWVCQVAGRHCIDKLRRRKREKCWIVAGNDLCALPDVSTPSPLSQVLHKEATRQVREQLSRLPDNYRVPLLLRYYKRMSYSEIARTLNRGLPAVKTTIFRAKNELRRNLGVPRQN
jgi:RNA polymerase sigma-70 factor, ECF subfamily